MKYTIEIITGKGLIDRVIECDYLSIEGGRFNFMIRKEQIKCGCGTKYSADESVGSYPQSAVIILKAE